MTMKAFGLQEGILAVSEEFSNFIHGVSSFSVERDVKTKATGIPLCELSKSINVYNGNCKRNEWSME